MNSPGAEPRQHDHDGVLRNALHAAAEAVEPGADGLGQIRAKIAAKQAASRRVAWQVRVALGAGRPWWRAALPPPGWLPAMFGTVAERFRPDPNRAGWFGWLRPLAAIFTGLFVVTAASWAVAALPSEISSPTSFRHYASPYPGYKRHHRPTSVTSYQGGTSASGGGTTIASGHSGGRPKSSPTPSCSTPAATLTGSPTPTGSPSSSPTQSPTPTGSPSTSPTQSPTPTGSPSTTPSASPTPSSSSVGGSPTPRSAAISALVSPATSTTPDATGETLLSLDAVSLFIRGEHVKAEGTGALAQQAVGGVPTPTSAPTTGAPAPSTTPQPSPAPCTGS